MEKSPSLKKEQFRVTIRRQHIQHYLKSRRKELHDQLAQQQNSDYLKLVEFSTAENIKTMTT